MYHLFLALQCVGIILFAVEICFVLFQRESKLKTLLLLFCISGLINCIGYFCEMRAGTLNEAMLAVKFTYLGKPFIILTLFLYAMELCHIKVPTWLVATLTGFQTILVGVVFTCDMHSLYYKNIKFSFDGLFPHMVVTHGIIYGLFMIEVFLLFGFAMVVCIRFFIETKQKSEKLQAFLMFMTFFVGGLSYAVFLSRVTKGYDTTALAYLFGGIFICVTTLKYHLYDVVCLGKEHALQHIENGVIVTDTIGNIIYSNQLSEKILAEISEAGEKKPLSWLVQNGKQGNEMHIGNRVYMVNNHDVIETKMKYGDLYIISDITKEYKIKLASASTEALVEGKKEEVL